MAGKIYQFNNPRDVKELQQMLLKPDNENDRVKCEDESDLEDDYVEVHSEDLDTEQDISNEESEDELDMNEEYFLERVKDGGKIQLRRQIRK